MHSIIDIKVSIILYRYTSISIHDICRYVSIAIDESYFSCIGKISILYGDCCMVSIYTSRIVTSVILILFVLMRLSFICIKSVILRCRSIKSVVMSSDIVHVRLKEGSTNDGIQCMPTWTPVLTK